MIPWFLTPDAHRTRYLWRAAFAGHAALGVALWLVWAVAGLWAAVPAAVLSYVLLIETAQLVLWRAVMCRRPPAWLVWDAVLDSVAVTFGVLVAGAIHDRELAFGLALAGAALAVIWTGGQIRPEGDRRDG